MLLNFILDFAFLSIFLLKLEINSFKIIEARIQPILINFINKVLSMKLAIQLHILIIAMVNFMI